MPSTIRVWDLPTRLFHWVLAVGVIGLIATGYLGIMQWHFRLGYMVLALLLFRLVWGVIGGRWSRFGNFIYSPASLVRHLRGAGHPDHAIGHSPLGALSVFALLLILALQVLTGLTSDDAISFTGPLAPFVSSDLVDWATGYHKDVGQWLVIALVVLHVLAIAFYRVAKGQNLTTAMIGGDKTVDSDAPPPSSRDDVRMRLLALVLLAVCAAVAWWVQRLGA
jgi:cytochrome b